MNPTVIAAIDVGSSAIRMELAEVGQEGNLRVLESLARGVTLGKDSFTSRHLSEESIQTACQVLARLLARNEGVRCHALSRGCHQRSAGSQPTPDMFLDRAFLRSGIDVEVIDGAEQNRLTYLAIHDALSGILDLQARNVLVVEVGGGSTDVSFLQAGETLNSGTFALGAVRLRQVMLEVEGDQKQKLKFLDRQIKNEIKTITNSIPLDRETRSWRWAETSVLPRARCSKARPGLAGRALDSRPEGVRTLLQ